MGIRPGGKVQRRMRVEDNVTFAKRSIVDMMYFQARLEGIAVTFPQTAQIYEGRSVAGLTIMEVKAVNNLKHAWQFTFDSIEYPLDLRWLSQLHYEVGKEGVVNEAGDLRRVSVPVTTGIADTLYWPDIPDREDASARLQEISREDAALERALDTLLYISKAQLFNDGNKRVATIAANKVLIMAGAGLLAIRPEQDEEFRNLLVSFYLDDGKASQLKDFLRESCYSNPDIRPTRERSESERLAFMRPDPKPVQGGEKPPAPEAGDATPAADAAAFGHAASERARAADPRQERRRDPDR